MVKRIHKDLENAAFQSTDAFYTPQHRFDTPERGFLVSSKPTIHLQVARLPIRLVTWGTFRITGATPGITSYPAEIVTLQDINDNLDRTPSRNQCWWKQHFADEQAQD